MTAISFSLVNFALVAVNLRLMLLNQRRGQLSLARACFYVAVAASFLGGICLGYGVMQMVLA